jgi:hypothetical protein
MMIALILFGMAAAGGLVLALIRFSGKPYPPLALALVHGALAAAALIALVVAVTDAAATGSTKIALVLFLAAAAGGFALFSRHLRKLALPVWLVVVHALVAVTAFAVLLSAVL